MRGVAGYRVHPAHFAERFSLIVIIALGESIVAIGVGAGDEPLGTAVAVAAVLALIASAALWWAYFDVVAQIAQRRLAELRGTARNLLARDAFAYLHLPMIAGIELFALGVEQVVGHVDEPLEPEASAALFGGVALYLLAHVAFKLRNGGSFGRQRAGRGGAVRGGRAARHGGGRARRARPRGRDRCRADRLRGDPLPRVARPGTAGGMTDPGGGYGWRSGGHLPRRRGGVFGLGPDRRRTSRRCSARSGRCACCCCRRRSRCSSCASAPRTC